MKTKKIKKTKSGIEGVDCPCSHCGAYGHSALGCSFVRNAFKTK